MPVWNEENSSLKKNAFVGIPKAGSTTIRRYMEKYSDGISNDTNHLVESSIKLASDFFKSKGCMTNMLAYYSNSLLSN